LPDKFPFYNIFNGFSSIIQIIQIINMDGAKTTKIMVICGFCAILCTEENFAKKEKKQALDKKLVNKIILKKNKK